MLLWLFQEEHHHGKPSTPQLIAPLATKELIARSATTSEGFDKVTAT